jgi:hypothetical protein
MQILPGHYEKHQGTEEFRVKLIMCVSKNGGISFNNRRQSRDEEVCKDMIALSGGSIFASEYSAKLFDGIGKVQICDAGKMPAGQYYFAERGMPEVDEQSISEVVLYHWNREYPADSFFDIDLKDFRLKENVEFEGKSHDCIRRERWIR